MYSRGSAGEFTRAFLTLALSVVPSVARLSDFSGNKTGERVRQAMVLVLVHGKGQTGLRYPENAER
jgi:hypothetical protein